MKILSAAAACLLSSLALAQQECVKPAPRPTIPIATAIGQDESMAQSFELAAAACTTETIGCDDARSKCGASLTQTLQRQIGFDEGAYLRDMLIAYQGQQYRMSTPIPAASALTDVSCNADAAALKAAASRRSQQAERRKLLAAEYPRWITWAQQQFQLCQDRSAADRVRADAQAADAAKLLAAAELAKKAEDAKLTQARAAEKALKEKAEADARAKEAQQEQLRAAQAEAQRQRELAIAAATEKAEADKRAAAERAEAEKRARENAEETAARQKREAEDARIVAEREGRKESAKLKQSELMEKEKAREDEMKSRHEQSRRAAEAAHAKKVEELKRSLELSESEKSAQLEEADRVFAESESKRREQALKEIEAAGHVDRSDERLTGALSGHGAAGYVTISDSAAAASTPLVGGQVSIRQGFWGVAPADGMASGVELRGTGLFLIAPNNSASLIQVSPEFRYWFGRVALGAAFEWQSLKSTLKSGVLSTSTIGLGPTLSLAAVDSPDARLFLTLRWLPILNNQFERITGEIEGGYAIFSFAVQGGVLKDTSTATIRTGWFAGASIGARLRW
jgi:hypothetical protein